VASFEKHAASSARFGARGVHERRVKLTEPVGDALRQQAAQFQQCDSAAWSLPSTPLSALRAALRRPPAPFVVQAQWRDLGSAQLAAGRPPQGPTPDDAYSSSPQLRRLRRESPVHAKADELTGCTESRRHHATHADASRPLDLDTAGRCQVSSVWSRRVRAVISSSARLLALDVQIRLSR